MKDRAVVKALKIAAAVLVLLALLLPASSCETKNRPSRVIHVNAQLLLGDDYKTAGSAVCTVQIINEDTYDWHNVKLTVDELYVYKEKMAAVKAGETLSLPLTDFMLAGDPYDIKKYKPYKVGVIADEGSYFYGWNNQEELAEK